MPSWTWAASPGRPRHLILLGLYWLALSAGLALHGSPLGSKMMSSHRGNDNARSPQRRVEWHVDRICFDFLRLLRWEWRLAAAEQRFYGWTLAVPWLCSHGARIRRPGTRWRQERRGVLRSFQARERENAKFHSGRRSRTKDDLEQIAGRSAEAEIRAAASRRPSG